MRKQQPLDYAVPGANDHLDGLPLAVAFEIGERGEIFADEDMKVCARRRQGDAPAFASDELGAKEFFKFPDLTTIKTLPGRLALGGPGDAAGLGDKAETLQAIQRQPALAEQFHKHDSKVMVLSEIHLVE